MALTFFVEDQTHQRLRVFTDDSRNSFLVLCRKATASGTAVLDVVDPYTDTMLNFIQLDRLMPELSAMLSGGELTPDETLVADEVLTAAREAREISGYLFIEGD